MWDKKEFFFSDFRNATALALCYGLFSFGERRVFSNKIPEQAKEVWKALWKALLRRPSVRITRSQSTPRAGSVPFAPLVRGTRSNVVQQGKDTTLTRERSRKIMNDVRGRRAKHLLRSVQLRAI